MTQTQPSSGRTPRIVIIATALLFGAPNLHAQDCDEALTEMEAALTEVEAVNHDVVAQRNQCIAINNKTRSERDRCLGHASNLSVVASGLNVRLADYERVIARHEARTKPWVFYVAGVVTPIIATGLGLLIYLAAM